MHAPQESFYREPQTEMMILFKIIGRRSWDELRDWQQAFPGSKIEHVLKGTGIFVLVIPPDGSKDLAA